MTSLNYYRLRRGHHSLSQYPRTPCTTLVTFFPCSHFDPCSDHITSSAKILLPLYITTFYDSSLYVSPWLTRRPVEGLQTKHSHNSGRWPVLPSSLLLIAPRPGGQAIAPSFPSLSTGPTRRHPYNTVTYFLISLRKSYICLIPFWLMPSTRRSAYTPMVSCWE